MGSLQPPQLAENGPQKARRGSVQHNSVAGVGSNFGSLTLCSLFLAYETQHNLGESFLVIINSTPHAQQSLRHNYIKTLIKYKRHLP